ncbi:MAG: cobalamin-dependent protein [Planctomycetes bacterium]|nr:cobalamin-dependent protein [Planctomycetota bacterium]
MRVLIVAANQEHKPDPVVPLGAAFVAGAARSAGHDVCLLDACFEGEEFPVRLEETLRRFEPQVVGVSLRNIDNTAWPHAMSYLPAYRRLMATLRQTSPSACVVLGGSAFTLMPEALMADLTPDFGVIGPGEAAFAALLADISAGRRGKTRGADFQNCLLRGEQYPAEPVRPAWDLLDLDKYYSRGGALNVQTKRGCAFTCNYCTYPLLEGSVSVGQDVTLAVDELERLAGASGARHFFVVDNTFNMPHDHAVAFCERLAARKLDLEWTAYVTPRGMTPGLARMMAAAGCRSVELGTDAGALETLRGLGKSFGIDDIKQASTALKSAGIKFSHCLIMGGPGETAATLAQTVECIVATEPDFVIAMLGVRVYPRTRIARTLERQGWIGRERIGLDPVFYIDPAVRDLLVPFALDTRKQRSNWYFPGLEGDRWLRYWRRQRQLGARGPLWALRPAAVSQ